MRDFSTFLAAEAVFFLAPAGFAWFAAFCLRRGSAIGRNLLIGTLSGLGSSAVLFVAFWPMIFPPRESPAPVDGQAGLGQGLVIIALIASSYLIAGGYVLIRTLAPAAGREREPT